MNYYRYRFTGKELVKNIFMYVVAALFISYLFYDSFVPFMVSVVFIPVYLKKRGNRLLGDLKDNVKNQFCELISCVSASLSAGVSAENAFRNSEIQMKKAFGEAAPIVLELKEMALKMEVNVSLTDCLLDFSKRAQIEDISNFVTVFTEAIRSGGNLRSIIKNTVSVIQDKKRVEDEIKALLKGKMLEQKVMSVIPFIIFIYMRISSGEFISVLYHNPAGVIVMTLSLVIYFVSIIVSEKMVSIKV